MYTIRSLSLGADPGILGWGRGGNFFFKGMGSGATLRPSVGQGQRPGGGPGGETPGS